jgi:hypothetical protein
MLPVGWKECEQIDATGRLSWKKLGTEQVVYERPAAKWDYRLDETSGYLFFVDHVNQTTSWAPPVWHEGAAHEPVMPYTVATAAPNAHANPSVARPAPSSVPAASVPSATVGAASSAAPSLPAGWRQFADPRGVPYFVGPSGQPQWEHPSAPQSLPAPPAHAPIYAAAQPTAYPNFPNYSQPAAPSPGLPAGWREQRDASGRPYYTGPSGQYQWQHPYAPPNPAAGYPAAY